MGSNPGVVSLDGGGGDERAKPPASPRAQSSRDEVNLRLLVEIRRRLKSAAEKELSVGRDRMRGLRNQLHGAEADLRLCVRAIDARREQLARTATTVESARERALTTAHRLRAIQEENQDFGEQLSAARTQAARLRESVYTDRAVQHGTLDAFLTATNALTQDLRLAAGDHEKIRTRVADLVEESSTLASRGESLLACLRAADRALGVIGERVSRTLDHPAGQAPEEVSDGHDHPSLEEAVRTTLST